ncbi:hypothetical protein GOODEAATRI_031260 [Goodea atripinnis]|uniref:Secreted protein n=1 Tax=Goodea atripinnis TaxID=208336 RepID=A0ABV0PII3_9TELE
MQLFAPSLCLYLFKSHQKESVCWCVCVGGGGVSARVEQSCNEQILQRQQQKGLKTSRGWMTCWDFTKTLARRRQRGKDSFCILILGTRAERRTGEKEEGGRFSQAESVCVVMDETL